MFQTEGLMRRELPIRRTTSWVSMLLGAAAVICGFFLPWGVVRGKSVSSSTPSMIIFMFALLLVALLNVVAGVLTLSGGRTATLTRALAISSAILAITIAVLLPAGISVGVNEQGFPSQGGPNVTSFQSGAWMTAAGLVLVLAGAAIILTNRVRATIVGVFMMPIMAAVLVILELR